MNCRSEFGSVAPVGDGPWLPVLGDEYVYAWPGVGLLEELRERKWFRSGLLSTSDKAGCYPP